MNHWFNFEVFNKWHVTPMDKNECYGIVTIWLDNLWTFMKALKLEVGLRICWDKLIKFILVEFEKLISRSNW